MTDGRCDDCGKIVQIGEWPFDCNNLGHGHLIRLAVLGKNRQREQGPPMPFNPMPGPVITRDWMDSGGNVRPMPKEEWNRNFIGEDA
jgi:hypothetical protein